MSDEGYATYRGRCKEVCEELIKEDPSLRLARGWYECPMWGDQQHWWCVREDGTIVDPTVSQFPTEGVCATYREYDGVVTCEECGKELPEDDAQFDGHHAFCSGRCHAACIGILQGD